MVVGAMVVGNRVQIGDHHLATVLQNEGLIHPQQHLLLLRGQPTVAEEHVLEIVTLALLENPGAHVERLRRQTECLGDLLEDLSRRLAQTPFDLAQVRVGDAGDLRELAQRHADFLSLLTDERAQFTEAGVHLHHLPIPRAAGPINHDPQDPINHDAHERRLSTDASPL